MAELNEPRGLNGDCVQLALDAHTQALLTAAGVTLTRWGIQEAIVKLAQNTAPTLSITEAQLTALGFTSLNDALTKLVGAINDIRGNG